LGIVHADLKPDNIFIAKNGQFIVGDFGLCIVGEPDMGTLPSLRGPCGTPGYMAPEVFLGSFEDIHFSGPADIFAYGCILYDLLMPGCTVSTIIVQDAQTLTVKLTALFLGRRWNIRRVP
jgi:serine/threonine protein kinase